MEKMSTLLNRSALCSEGTSLLIFMDAIITQGGIKNSHTLSVSRKKREEKLARINAENTAILIADLEHSFSLKAPCMLPIIPKTDAKNPTLHCQASKFPVDLNKYRTNESNPGDINCLLCSIEFTKQAIKLNSVKR